MGQLLMTGLGAIAGFMIGGPFGAQIGAMIGGAIGSALFGPTIEGPRLQDLSVSTSTYGNAIPRLFGTARMSTNLMWTAGIKEKKTKKSAGKGGPKQTTYSYSASFAVGICAGPVDGLLRIWADGKLIAGTTDPIQNIGSYNGFLPKDLIIQLISGKKKSKYKTSFFDGSEDQMPSAVMEAKEGVGNVPAHRGLAYLVFENMPLEDFGNRIPQITVEVTKALQNQVPYMHIQTEEGGYVNYGNTWLAWEQDRWIIEGNGRVQHWSLSTHELILDEPINFGYAPSKLAMSPDGTYWMHQVSSSNNRPFYRTSTFGGTGGGMGRQGNFFDEYPVTRCCGPGVPVWMANGDALVVRVGGTDYFVNNSGFGGGSIYTTSFAFVAITGSYGNLIRLGEFPAGEDGSKAQSFYGQWAQEGTYFNMNITRILEGASGTISDPITVPAYECDCEYKHEAYNSNKVSSVGGINIDLGAYSIHSVFYDQTDNSVIVFYGTMGPGGWGDWHNHAIKISLTEQAIKWHNKDMGNTISPSQGMVRNTRLQGGTLGWAGDFPPRAYEIDLSSGQLVRDMGISGTGFSTHGWDDASKSLFSTYYSQGGTGGAGTGWTRIVFAGTSGKVTVGSIVAEILDETGQLAPTDYDTSSLNDEVVGYIISREATARDCIQQLATAYFFDAVESDYKLKFIKRGTGSKVTILENQMGNVEDRDTQFKETLAQETEAPMRVTVNYMDQSRDYQTGAQHDKRKTNPFPTMNSRSEAKLELPIVMSATEAKRIANKALKMVWTNRTMGEAKLPWKFLKYDATDVVTINLGDGSSRLVRLTRMDLGADMSLKVSTVSEAATAYTSTVEADDSRGGVPPQNAGVYGPVTLQVINTPLLRDEDDTNGGAAMSYYAAYSVTAQFSVAYVDVKGPTDTLFNELVLLTEQAVAGTVVEKLPPTKSWNAVDPYTTITVRLNNSEDELESIAYSELMSGGNAALIGNEVIQFQDADLNDDGTWTLSNILRARRGTESWVTKHVAGERFVLLELNGAVQPVGRQNKNFEVPYTFRATPPGALAEDSPVIYRSLSPNDQRPYAPEDVNVFEDPEEDADTVTIQGRYRPRLTFPMTDIITTPPFSDGSGNYEFNIYPGLTQEYVETMLTWDGSTTLGDSTRLADEDKLTFTQEALVGTSTKDPRLTLPLADATEEFVAQITLYGFGGAMRGFPKFVHAKRVGPNDWNVTELY